MSLDVNSVINATIPRASLHSLGEHDQNEVPHGLFDYVISLALALVSGNADGVINDSIAFLR